jgi:hypothetical protein
VLGQEMDRDEYDEHQQHWPVEILPVVISHGLNAEMMLKPGTWNNLPVLLGSACAPCTRGPTWYQSYAVL